jgi:glutamate 5-kinase
VICSGGGGVPVVRARDGALSGIDAVIDKDLAAALLAREVAADALLILTDVPQACVDYGRPEQRPLSRVTLSEMRDYAAAGHFKAGSMGPKVNACMRFVEAGGTAVIASLTEVAAAMAGEAGTRIVGDQIKGEAPRRSSSEATSKAPSKSHKRKADAKKAGAKRAAARKVPGKEVPANKTARPVARVIDISEARKRASGGRP